MRTVSKEIISSDSNWRASENRDMAIITGNGGYNLKKEKNEHRTMDDVGKKDAWG